MRQWLKASALAAWTLATVVAYGYSPPFDHNQEARAETTATVNWMRARIQSTPPGAPVYFMNRVFFAVPPIWVSAFEFPGWAGLFTIFFPENVVDGRRVFFAEKEPSIIEAHRNGRRTATLLVPLAQMPQRAAPPPPGRRQ